MGRIIATIITALTMQACVTTEPMDIPECPGDPQVTDSKQSYECHQQWDGYIHNYLDAVIQSWEHHGRQVSNRCLNYAMGVKVVVMDRDDPEFCPGMEGKGGCAVYSGEDGPYIHVGSDQSIHRVLPHEWTHHLLTCESLGTDKGNSAHEGAAWDTYLPYAKSLME